MFALSLQSRGAFLGAISSTNTNYVLPLVLREALGLPYDRPTGPYAKRSAALAEYGQGLRAFEVPPQLSVDEAAALFEVWSGDLALHTGECRFFCTCGRVNGAEKAR
jgi:small subunit ribosomal protein S29